MRRDREDVAGELRRDRLAVLEPGEREPLRLFAQLRLVPFARDERDEEIAQQPRLLALPGLRRKAERPRPRAANGATAGR